MMERPRQGTARVEAVGPVDWLVCFAVREEAVGLGPAAGARPSRAVTITGMGGRNASRSIGTALAQWRPRAVITAGFAGGLDPDLERGTVVFNPADELHIGAQLMALKARPVVFHCAPRIAVTSTEKSELRRLTRADVVEMESAIIHAACRNAGVPCGTIRVISDSAGENLPLDFNSLLTATDQINWWKLARAVALRPSTISRLIAFQRQTRTAAGNLGRVLTEVIKSPPRGGTIHGVP